MARSRKQPPQMQDDLVENRFDAAIDYAIELLTGFAETAESITVAVLLDSLTDEYWRAKRNRRGMDPDHVRIMVQGLLDAVDFRAKDRPDEYDPEADRPAPTSQLSMPPPIFRFSRERGADARPEHEIAALSFTLGAVMTRFELKLYRNAQPKPNKPLDGKVSACDAVAAANARLGRNPLTYSALRKVIGDANRRVNDGEGKKLNSSNPAMEEGKLQGELDRLNGRPI